MTDVPTAGAREATRAVLETVFHNVSGSGFGPEFQATLADDVVFTATGESPLAGRYEGKSEYVAKVLGPLHERLATPLTPVVEQMIVDDEWAAVRFRTEGVRARNGADFSMTYCWLIKVVNGWIVEVVGFYDQKKMFDLFA